MFPKPDFQNESMDLDFHRRCYYHSVSWVVCFRLFFIGLSLFYVLIVSLAGCIVR